jgi:osmoprotectant transport system substrate-binding protein
MTHRSTLTKLRRGVLAAALVPALLALGACGDSSGGDPLSGGGSGEEADAGTIVVGSANFTENVLLAEMYAGMLESRGVEVEKRLNIGAREAYIQALQNGEINLLPEYSGALLEYYKKSPESTDPEGVFGELESELPEDLALLEPAEAEDKSVLAVTEETAQEYDLATIEDLVPVAGELVLGGAPEFETRRAGVVGLEEVYGLEFEKFTSLDPGGPLTRSALDAGDIDVANLFSTDPAIATEGYVVLEDTENLFLAQQIVPVLQDSAVTPEVEEALDELSAVLTTENLTQALADVTVDKREPADVAQQFLEDNGLV